MSANRAAALLAATGLALAALMPPVLGAINPAPGADGASGAPGDEQCLASRINSARRAAGGGTLAIHSGLISVGRRHSAEMYAAGRWYHSTDLGSKVKPLGAVKWGENVGWATDCSYMDNFFINSAVHRNNRLNPIFTHVGVGVVAGSDGKIWVTELFMRSGSAAPLQNPPPAPKADIRSPDPIPAPVVKENPTPTPPSKVLLPKPKPSVKATVVKKTNPKGKIVAYEDMLETEPGLLELASGPPQVVGFELGDADTDTMAFTVD